MRLGTESGVQWLPSTEEVPVLQAAIRGKLRSSAVRRVGMMAGEGARARGAEVPRGRVAPECRSRYLSGSTREAATPMERREFRAPRGIRDVLPEEIPAWRLLEETARRLAALRGYREIRPALLEEVQLFTRSVGEVT